MVDDRPGVKESAVIGVPHPDFGEGVVAILVPEAGQGLDLDAVAAAVAGKIANYKRPKEYIVRDELPRNTMGKVQKNVLRAEYAGIFDATHEMKRACE